MDTQVPLVFAYGKLVQNAATLLGLLALSKIETLHMLELGPTPPSVDSRSQAHLPEYVADCRVRDFVEKGWNHHAGLFIFDIERSFVTRSVYGTYVSDMPIAPSQENGLGVSDALTLFAQPCGSIYPDCEPIQAYTLQFCAQSKALLRAISAVT